MKGKTQFTRLEVTQIRRLLTQKPDANEDEQKRIRKQLRGIDFYISDFSSSTDGFFCADFDQLVRDGSITIVDAPADVTLSAISTIRQPSSARNNSDEAYILDLCDEILGSKCYRQHRFSFLVGDTGHPLPVDGYYPRLNLVIEYRERQHSESVPFFDRRSTVSGVSRGIQRQQYDQRRRGVLPKHGIQLIEFSFDEFAHLSDKRLRRDKLHDLRVLRAKLSQWTSS